MMILRLLVTILVIAMAFSYLTGRFGGGERSTVSIAALQTEPGRWENKHVRVSGTVGARFAVLGFGGFTLTDANGTEIVVIGHPAKPGQAMTVEGRFVAAFALGDTSIAAILMSGSDQ